jgi:PilZ domain-containing protein
MEERRAARRFNLALEVKLKSELKQFQPTSGFTRDISINGFCFGTSQKLSIGTKIWFSIMLTPSETTTALISGRARVVRVEEISGTEQRGIGAVIEGYRFGKTSTG